MDQSHLTRIVQAIKGNGRFADTKSRFAVSTSTTRDCLAAGSVATVGSVLGRASTLNEVTVVSITDTNGDLFCMLDAQGAADDATLS